MAYSNPQNKTHTELEEELLTVFAAYPEYREIGFEAMVRKFAGDNFYKLHLVAQEYLTSPYAFEGTPPLAVATQA